MARLGVIATLLLLGQPSRAELPPELASRFVVETEDVYDTPSSRARSAPSVPKTNHPGVTIDVLVLASADLCAAIPFVDLNQRYQDAMAGTNAALERSEVHHRFRLLGGDIMCTDIDESQFDETIDVLQLMFSDPDLRALHENSGADIMGMITYDVFGQALAGSEADRLEFAIFMMNDPPPPFGRNWSPYRATGTSPLAIEGGLESGQGDGARLLDRGLCDVEELLRNRSPYRATGTSPWTIEGGLRIRAG